MYILLALAFVERLIYICQTGTESMLVAYSGDSQNYLVSGLILAKTGVLTYNGSTTALIMPGISAVIAVLSMMFGEGELLLRAIQILWMAIGSLTLIFIYKAANLFVPKWCALLTSAVYLYPLHVVIDGYLFTECPFFLFFAMSLYYMLKMGSDSDFKYAVKFGLSVLAALMFRANVLILLFFAFIYLLIQNKYSFKELAKRVCVVAAILAVFIVPWTIRNYKLFDDFIPVTYGLYNPTYEGSMQGDFYPIEDELDYSIVEEQYWEQYGHYYNEDHSPKNPAIVQYLNHMHVKLTVEYRMGEWFKQKPLHFLKTHLLDKPRWILNWAWYWREFLGLKLHVPNILRKLNFLFCMLTFVLSFVRKKYRKEVSFLLITYAINLILVAYAMAIDRYAQAIMPYRYLVTGIGIYLVYDTVKYLFERRKNLRTE